MNTLAEVAPAFAHPASHLAVGRFPADGLGRHRAFARQSCPP